MPSSSHILVTLLLVIRHFGCVIFCMMFSICKARWARQNENKQTIMWYFGNLIAKNKKMSLSKWDETLIRLCFSIRNFVRKVWLEDQILKYGQSTKELNYFKVLVILFLKPFTIYRYHSYVTKALAGGGGLENGILCLFSELKTCLRRVGVGSKKSKNVLIKYMNGPIHYLI